MKFNRAALLEATVRALQADRLNWEQKEAQVAESLAAAEAEWVKLNGDDWAAAARAIQRAIKRGEPVTEKMLPKERYGALRVYQANHSTPRPAYLAPPELRRLRTVLMTVADETVTTAGLRDFGLTGDVLRVAAKYMAREVVHH